MDGGIEVVKGKMTPEELANILGKGRVIGVTKGET
jgi:hypothetical protein